MRSTTLTGLSWLLGALAATGTAQAADLPSRTTPPVFAAVPLINYDDWSGVYVGTTYGYGFDHFRNRQLATGVSASHNANGQAGGALVGYNFQYGHFVFGAEGSIDENVIRSNNPTTAAFIGANNDSLYDIRFRGLLGYEFGQFMPFIAGGAVLNEGYMSGNNVGVPDYFGANRQTVGYTIGGGLEYKLFPQQLFPGLPSWLFGPVTLRGEYLYESLPSETYAYGGQVYRTRSDASFIRGALIYRFGDNPPRPYADAAGDVNWAGGYGGIIGGYGSPGVRTRVNGVNTGSIGADGGLGGIYAGTNFLFGHYMLGVDGTTAFTDLTGTRNINAPGVVTDPVRYRGYIQSDIRARAGYAFGNFLPFIAAGYSFERGEFTDSGVPGAGDPTGKVQRGRVPLDAFTVGGGLDYRLTQRVSLRIEDVYDFDSTRKSYDIRGNQVSFTRDGNTVRAGIAYHFE